MPWPKTGSYLVQCTVVLYDIGGTIQQSGCQLPGD